MLPRQFGLPVFFAMMLLSAVADAALPQWLTLNSVEGEAVLRYLDTQRNTDGSGSSRDSEFELGLVLAFTGHCIDPRILQFSLAIEPSYIWGEFSSASVNEDRDGEFLQYIANVELFNSDKLPVGANLSSMQAKNLNTGSLGSRSENEIQRHSIATLWRNSFFPMALTLQHIKFKDDFRSGLEGPFRRREEETDSLLLTGSSSKLKVLYEHQRLDDLIPERNHDFELDRANVTHRLNWGRNSSLFSRVQYYDRRGYGQLKRLILDETARIQHTENVRSRTRYSFSEFVRDFKTTNHGAGFAITHDLYQNLTTTLSVDGNHNRSDRLSEDFWRSGIETQYHRADLFGLGENVNLGGEFNYGETDRNSDLGLVEVLEEPHVVPLGGNVVLNRRFVVHASVRVTNFDGSLTYEEGFDYLVEAITNDLTQVQTIPGGRIDTGQTILVSYKALASPSLEFSTTNSRFNVGFNLHWLSFNHQSMRSDEELLSGFGESFLDDRRDATTTLDFRWKLGTANLTLGAERRYFRLNDFESTTVSLRQNISWPISPAIRSQVNLIQTHIDSDTRETELYSVEWRLTWNPSGRMNIRPFLGAWKRTDIDSADEDRRREDDFVTAGIDLRWQFRKINLDFSYYHNARTTDMQETNEDRVMLFLRRRFR